MTATIYDIIHSELNQRGFDEFENEGKWTFYDEDYQFIQKMLKFDDDVKTIVNQLFFKQIGLKDQKHDDHFKRSFVTRFLNREINAQTIEAFSSKLIYLFMVNEDMLNEVYNNFEKYIKQESKQTSSSNDGTESDTRALMSSLPQGSVNMNLDDDGMEYADTNNINKSRTQNTGTNESNSEQYNLETLVMVNELVDNFFNQVDEQCFLQIW